MWLAVHLATLARYPFLPEAAGRIANDGPTLEELLSERVYASARALGRERLLAAVEHGELPRVVLGAASPERELLEDLLSYVYARILVSGTKDAYIARRHALAEAVRVRGFLEEENDSGVVVAAAEVVDLKFEPSQGEFVGHFTDYLKYAVHLKDLEWKLVRQRLRGGRVQMERATVARLVQEGLRRRIEKELPKPLPDEALKAVEADLAPIMDAARIRQEQFASDGFGSVELPLIPPCMKHILGQLQRGENVAHSGRFALVTFLNSIGMTSEDIMTLFSTAPDFREDLTRYQVEHITGVSSGTTYSPPGCQAMQTFGICYNPDETCRSRKKDGDLRVKHPLSYYRYHKEAHDAMAPILAAVPVANPDAMRMRGATFYPFLRRMQDIGAEPHLADAKPEDALAIVDELKLPIAVEKTESGRALVFDPADDRAILEVADSNALRLRSGRRKAAAEQAAAADKPKPAAEDKPASDSA